MIHRGKSTLLSTILRCAEITNGIITVDGQDITQISRDAFRKRLMTLPQQALFLPGTIRHNMTMWNTDESATTDDGIEEALRKVGLWDTLLAVLSRNTDTSSQEEPISLLDSELNPEKSLSYGRQQLFCLARVLFQRGDAQIVLLDEVTSSVDHETGLLVHQILREQLAGKTVIEVLHQLKYIMDFDLVVLVDQGRVLEVGAPSELLARRVISLQPCMIQDEHKTTYSQSRILTGPPPPAFCLQGATIPLLKIAKWQKVYFVHTYLW